MMLTEADDRAARLADAIGAVQFRNHRHLTAARARKLRLLYEHGFDTAHLTESGYWYRRGNSKAMRLSDAVRCIHAMTAETAA